jgi:hypothetical protein
MQGDFVADSHSILARWRNHLSQLLNMCEVNDVRQTELHTAEPLVSEPSVFEVELTIEKLKSHKSLGIDQTELHTAEPLVSEPSVFEVELTIEKLKSHKSLGIDHIQAELIKAWGRTIRSGIHKLTISVWNKEKLPEEWKESIIVPIYKRGNKTDCTNYRGILLLPTMYKILSNILLSKSIPYA